MKEECNIFEYERKNQSEDNLQEPFENDLLNLIVNLEYKGPDLMASVLSSTNTAVMYTTICFWIFEMTTSTFLFVLSYITFKLPAGNVVFAILLKPTSSDQISLKGSIFSSSV